MSSRKLFQRASLTGIALVLCSLAIYKLVPEDAAPYTIFPGFLVGLMVATVLAAAQGNAHNVSVALIWVVGLIVNFLCYVAIACAVLSLWFKGPNKPSNEP
jgi:multisubunit Na+/H+ antiporter MnhE subunit